MRKSIMFLSSPRTRLQVINRRNLLSPSGLDGHLIKLRILHHHRMHNTQERLITWENGRSASKSISLHESLASMFAQDFDDTAAFGVGKLIPLEVTPSMVQYGIEFVAFELVWGEDPHGFGVLD